MSFGHYILLPDRNRRRRRRVTAREEPRMTVTVYCCAACGDEFESEFSMEESIAEYEENFRRKFKAEDVVPLCDDCYIEAMNEAAKAHLAGSMQ